MMITMMMVLEGLIQRARAQLTSGCQGSEAMARRHSDDLRIPHTQATGRACAAAAAAVTSGIGQRMRHRRRTLRTVSLPGLVDVGGRTTAPPSGS